VRPLDVFAVEDTTAQVCWSALPTGIVTVAAGPAEAKVESDGRPGAVVLEGLSPASSYPLTLDGMPVGRLTTLPAPPGRLLCRFAALTDVHIGEKGFGPLVKVRERRRAPGTEPYALRCTRAALAEAAAWGADAVVVKGDITDKGRPGQLAAVGQLLAGVPVPLEVVPGNHDVASHASDMRAGLAPFGITVPHEPWARDLPGIRLVMGLSARPGMKGGRIGEDQRRALAELAGAAPGPAFVVLHHHLQRFALPHFYPPGIPAPQGDALLDALAAANPATVVGSGHTHRHRTRRHGSVVVTETGSTKDYPGTWTGYAVHEGGIRQVVRRVAAPDCMAWTERCRWAVAGVWGRWAPGPLGQRCFTHVWP
jgi:predicted phosphodiesterase